MVDLGFSKESLQTSRNEWGWNEQGGAVRILGRDVWFDGETTISTVSLPMTSVLEGWTKGWFCCKGHNWSTTSQTVSDYTRSSCLYEVGVGQDLSGKKQKKKLDHLRSDQDMTWDGERREKARANFHKVPCVRLLEQAKRNITSTALIKVQPRWRKNNDVKANALLRKCGCIQSFHPLSCPMALYSLMSPHREGLYKIF